MLYGRKLRSRLGFTLVELLVVIAIIGILVALLLPAVQAAREAARRGSCGNNLKQIALAMHNFHDTYKNFPPGMNDDDTNCMGWGTYILPFMEQQPLYNKINFVFQNATPNGSNPTPYLFTKTELGHPNVDNWVTGGQNAQPWRVNNPQQQPNTKLILESYLCPSNALPRKDNNGYGTSHYVGSAGIRPQLLGHNYNCGNFRGRFQVGILTFDNHNRNTWCWGMKDVIDGTSNTFIVGEVGKSAGLIEPTITNHGNFPLWAGGNNNQGCNTNYIGCHLRFCDDLHFLNRRDNTLLSTRSFGSYHPGGAQFALADGSVRFVPNTINLLIYRYLGDRRDEQPVKLP